MKLLPKSLIFITLIVLSGCLAGPNYAPVVEQKERAKSIPDGHIVKPGETLYSIAWRYNMEVRTLAVTNNIDSSFLIFPGQILMLKASSKAKKNRKKSPVNANRNTSRKHLKKITSSDNKYPTPTASRKATSSSDLSHSVEWKWPAKGKLDRLFNSRGGVHKGIDIKGKLGEPVYAAGNGKVVYAGSGLVGYGILLIIKHNESYLSAYGHNKKLLVSEGVFVKEGQQVAEIGDTGTDEVKLHFEIRHNGKPVDPLRLLPRSR